MLRMIIEAITAVGQAVAQVFGFANKRTDLKNQPDVQKAKAAQSELDAEAAETRAVAERDLEQTRKNLAE